MQSSTMNIRREKLSRHCEHDPQLDKEVFNAKRAVDNKKDTR